MRMFVIIRAAAIQMYRIGGVWVWRIVHCQACGVSDDGAADWIVIHSGFVSALFRRMFVAIRAVIDGCLFGLFSAIRDALFTAYSLCRFRAQRIVQRQAAGAAVVMVRRIALLIIAALSVWMFVVCYPCRYSDCFHRYSCGDIFYTGSFL